MKLISLTLTAVLALLLAGCQDQHKAADVAPAAVADSAKDAHLEQINQQLQQLTAEVVRLQQQVAAIPAAAAAPQAQQPRRLALGLSDTRQRLGSDDVEYAIVEFMDYQCPYCVRHSSQTLPTLKRKYIDSGLVQYVVKDFPLEFHAQAENAAIAARCAAEQGQFEAMHNALLENTRSLSSSIYDGLAAGIGLQADAFESCFNEPSQLTDLRKDVSEAVRLGVSGTPRFLIGRVDGDDLVDFVSVSGAQSLARFDEALQQVFNQGA
ncbi:DsbA family protein [Candidatus Thalassolituus haligoni]|uniref:DsbA family protein n=1 Tax=Candidatus Thalassolituus haligoni TaxID=3100113 RepID=UPI0035129BCD